MGTPRYYQEYTYAGAEIADFVAYIPFAPTLDAPVPSVAARFVFIDFGEPGRNDLMQYYLYVPIAPGWLEWIPYNMADDAFYADHPDYLPGDPIPVTNGNIQVHVGATDG